MYTCDDGHDEIVYEGVKCPLCDLLEEHRDLDEQCEDLKKETEGLKEEITSLKDELREIELSTPDAD